MKIFFIVLAVLVACVCAYWIWNFSYKYNISKRLIQEAKAYSIEGSDFSKTLLVMGDSTGVGVGASRPEDSVAGRLAVAMRATYVENRSVSGAMVADLATQMADVSRERYDTVLIQIGANDIVHFHNAQETADALLPFVQKAKMMSDEVIVISAGNMGAVTNFPFPIRLFYTNLTLKYHAAFTAMATKTGAVYVNLYTSPDKDPFKAHPEIYLAADGFHPSSEGYGLWFERLKATVQEHEAE